MTTLANYAVYKDAVLDYITGESLRIGDLTYPSVDGLPGQVLTTDGAGHLIFANASLGDVVGPVTATDNAIARYNGTTGKLIQNSLVTISDAGVLTAPSIATNGFAFPLADGTAGQVLTTNGAGVLSFATPAVGNVVGPASATDNALVRFDTTTGKLIQNSTAILSDTGVLTVSRLISGPVSFPLADGTSGQVLTTNGAGVLSFTNAGTGDVVGPASATDNAVARFDTTTGKLIQNSTVTISDTGVLTASRLVSGPVSFPLADGTSGQVLTTNGAGVLSFTTVGDVRGPASATDNAITRYDTTTGKLIQNSLSTIDDAGKMTTPNLQVGVVNYAAVDSVDGSVLTTNGAGVTSFQDPYLGRVSAAQTVAVTTNIGVGDHIQFDRIIGITGAQIALDTMSAYTTTPANASIGRITCKAGGRYILFCRVKEVLATAPVTFTVGWFDLITRTLVSLQQPAKLVGDLLADHNMPVATAVVMPSGGVDGRYEARILANTNVTSLVRMDLEVTQTAAHVKQLLVFPGLSPLFNAGPTGSTIEFMFNANSYTGYLSINFYSGSDRPIYIVNRFTGPSSNQIQFNSFINGSFGPDEFVPNILTYWTNPSGLNILKLVVTATTYEIYVNNLLMKSFTKRTALPITQVQYGPDFNPTEFPAFVDVLLNGTSIYAVNS